MAFGMTLAGMAKTIIPVVWDVDPGQLPGWMNRFTALDLRDDLAHRIGPALDGIAARVSAKKQHGALAVGAIVAGLLLFGAAQDEKERQKQRQKLRRLRRSR